MKQDELLKYCKYYKGEDYNPFVDKNQDKALFWDWEQKWLVWAAQHNDTDDNLLDTMLYEYIQAGMDNFEINDGVPISLKALLFNRYFHWNEYSKPADFMNWYVNTYRS